MAGEWQACAEQEWWHDAVVYQVYPRSFADANGDGMGDLAGLIGRLGYLAGLGIDAIWLSPFYPSPQIDAGYDVSDYCGVDPMFGTLADFDELLAEAHRRGLRVIVDLIPNHCSAAHPRFQAALAAPAGDPARDWFIFRDGRGSHGELPPNNWWGTDQGSAWTRVRTAGHGEQWYLHLFDRSQPDWNWDNPDVWAMFDGVLRFWLARGVDGFRVDVSHGMAKQSGLPDCQGDIGPVIHTTEAASRPPMWDQDAVHDIHRHLRAVLAQFPGERILIAEAWLELERLRLYLRPDEMRLFTIRGVVGVGSRRSRV
ncbi:MAG: alpha-amylase family glycosyl hydrolase, partial [Candidatus Nanopelagicales bacterium]